MLDVLIECKKYVENRNANSYQAKQLLRKLDKEIDNYLVTP